VLWLDAAQHRWVEELNAMNVVFVWDREGRTVVTTPPLTGTILDGVTRDSLLSVLADVVAAGDASVDEVSVEPTSIEHLRAGAEHGTLRESFACGTAAVIAPIGRFVHDQVEWVLGDGRPGPITMDLRRRLLDVQYGRAEDRHGWVVRVPEG
jgi:branched-chain amino acid aminotransferase